MKRTAEREQFLADIICTAIEGGTGYWAQVSAYKWTEGAAKTRATIHEINDEETGYSDEKIFLTIDTIASGIARIKFGEINVSEGTRQFITQASAENDAGMIDAGDADLITQAATLGEIRYG
jgi:hypothetical protein